MNTINFTEEEKIEFFDAIAGHYFNHNFGTMLKADVDTLIFSTYIEHCLKNNLPFDDYTLSISLGITESRIRSLKERKQLQYPYKNYDWKREFVKLIPNAKYNDVKKLVQINIGDVNLIKDVRHFIYENNWFDEFQLNPKLFQCRLEYFISLCDKLEEREPFDEETKRQLKKLAKSDREKSAIEKIISGSFEDGIKELVSIGSKLLLVKMLKLIPFGGLAGVAINTFINILDNSANE